MNALFKIYRNTRTQNEKGQFKETEPENLIAKYRNTLTHFLKTIAKPECGKQRHDLMLLEALYQEVNYRNTITQNEKGQFQGKEPENWSSKYRNTRTHFLILKYGKTENKEMERGPQKGQPEREAHVQNSDSC